MSDAGISKMEGKIPHFSLGAGVGSKCYLGLQKFIAGLGTTLFDCMGPLTRGS